MNLPDLIDALPTEWVRNYIETFEAGRVQKHPQARFVNRCGECCVVGALLGARAAGDVVRCRALFRGSELEELSRRFESMRLTPQELYEECLLTLVQRADVVQALSA